MPNMDTSYLTTQVTTIIGQLHGLFDDIGVETHERESREAEVRLSTTIVRGNTDAQYSSSSQRYPRL